MSVDESPRTGLPEREPRDERWYLTDEREFLLRSLSDADRERILGEKDPACLERWHERAVLAASVAEVIAEPSRAA